MQEFPSGNILTPIDDRIEVAVERGDGGRSSRGRTRALRADVYYRVYRSDGPEDVAVRALRELGLVLLPAATPIATTRDASTSTRRAATATTYRIGIGTNWLDDPTLGDVFVVQSTRSALLADTLRLTTRSSSSAIR